MALARLYTFSPSTLAQSAQVNAEFDQLVKILNGTKVDTEVLLTHNSTSPGLLVDNTGGGKVVEFRVAGVSKVEVKANGQLESKLATGTAPFVVASTTKVTNLNADLVGGIASTNLPKLDASNTFSQSATNAQTIQSTAGAASLTLQSVAATKWRHRVNNSGTFFLEYDSGSGFTTVLEATTGTLKWGANQLATESYVNARKIRWSFGAFYADQPNTATEQPVFIVPDGVASMTIDKIRYLYRNGTPSGSTTIKLEHLSNLGVMQNNWTVTLTSGLAKDSSQLDEIGDVVLTAGQQLRWTVTASNGHKDISLFAQGWQQPSS